MLQRLSLHQRGNQQRKKQHLKIRNYGKYRFCKRNQIWGLP